MSIYIPNWIIGAIKRNVLSVKSKHCNVINII